MAYQNPLLARWRAGETTFGYWATFDSPWGIEYAGTTNADWIAVDTQHGIVDYTHLVPMLLACRTVGKPSLVRVASNDPILIGKALDAGASGVIVPMVSTAAEAAAAVAASRYAPDGVRSFGPNRAALITGSLDASELADVAIIPMVETAAGLANVDGIAATPGVDAVLIGPTDLALGLGLGPLDRGPRHAEAVETIRAACERHGKVAGIVMGDGEGARTYAQRGFRMISAITEIGLFTTAIDREIRIARGG